MKVLSPDAVLGGVQGLSRRNEEVELRSEAYETPETNFCKERILISFVSTGTDVRSGRTGDIRTLCHNDGPKVLGP